MELQTAIRSGRLVVPIYVESPEGPATTPPLQPPFGLSRQQAVIIHAGAEFASDVRQLARQIDQQLGGVPPTPAILWTAAGLALWTTIVVAVLGVNGDLHPRTILQAAHAPTSILLTIPAGLALGGAIYDAARKRRVWWVTMLTALVVSIGCLLAVLNRLSVHAQAARVEYLARWAVIALALVFVSLIAPLVALIRYGLGSRRIIMVRRLGDEGVANVSKFLEGGLPYNVFISYRRVDSGSVCDLLYQRLDAKLRGSGFSRGTVFRDTVAILAGADFPTVLGRALARARVVLVLIGPHWLSARDDKGHSRLSSEDDLVRVEIRESLNLAERYGHKSIIPVLVDGASMPSVGDLPTDIAHLATLTPIALRPGPHFRGDLRRLTRQVRRLASVRPVIPGIQGAFTALGIFFGIAIVSGLVAWVRVPPYIIRNASCKPQVCLPHLLSPGIYIGALAGICAQLSILVLWALVMRYAKRIDDPMTMRKLQAPVWFTFPALLMVACVLASRSMIYLALWTTLGLLCVLIGDLVVLLTAYQVGYGLIKFSLPGDAQR